MPDQPGFAALETTILDAVRHTFEQHHFADKEQTMLDVARAVREAITTDRIVHHADWGDQPLLVIPLGAPRA